MRSATLSRVLPVILAAVVALGSTHAAEGRKGRGHPGPKLAGSEGPLSRVVVIRPREGGRAGGAGGSGFIVRLFDRTWVASNAHVLAGAEKLEIVTPDDTVLPWRRALIGRREDVALFEVETALEPLTLVPSVEASVRIGAKVVAFGNSQAQNAITRIPGEVQGIGPARLEVSCQFVGGNSGGPIVLEGTDRVVGISTYITFARPDRTGRGTRFEEDRRFAVRIDCLTREDFQDVDPKVFAGELRQVLEAKRRNDYGVQLIQDLDRRLGAPGGSGLRGDSQNALQSLALAAGDYHDAKIRDLVKLWNRTVETKPDHRGPGSQRADVEYRLRQFRAYLEAPYKGDPAREFQHAFLRDGMEQMGSQEKLSGLILDAFDDVSKRVLALLDRPAPDTDAWPGRPPSGWR